MSQRLIVTCDQTGAEILPGTGCRLDIRSEGRDYDFIRLQALLDWLLSPVARERYPEQFDQGSDAIVLALRGLASWRRTGETIPSGFSVERYTGADTIERTLLRFAHGQDAVTLEYQNGVAVGLFFDTHEVNAR